ncbi:hypothetical protein ACGF13_10855 [Kitasatospora sp. NPDC048286]|uniref:hypothetical protein n=1 Tax=Kitasatospora sp. NPDC048286 TaxID=3364047 RepID=UPI00371D9722
MTALAGARTPDATVQSLTSGFSAAFIGSAAIAVVGGLLAVATLRTPRPEGGAREARSATAL